jgi:hypothetical protein
MKIEQEQEQEHEHDYEMKTGLLRGVQIFATRACMFTAIIEYALLQLPLRLKE